jgi:hypothetical protein
MKRDFWKLAHGADLYSVPSAGTLQSNLVRRGGISSQVAGGCISPLQCRVRESRCVIYARSAVWIRRIVAGLHGMVPTGR